MQEEIGSEEHGEQVVAIPEDVVAQRQDHEAGGDQRQQQRSARAGREAPVDT